MAFFKIFHSKDLATKNTIPTTSQSPTRTLLPIERDLDTLKHKLYRKENQIKENAKRIENLEEKLEELENEEKKKSDKINRIFGILCDYEKLVTDVIAERENYINAKENFVQHLTTLEKAFTELHSKYEQAKSAVDGFASNERLLLSNLDEYCTKVNLLEHELDENTKIINEKTKELELLGKLNRSEIISLKSNMVNLEHNTTTEKRDDVNHSSVASNNSPGFRKKSKSPAAK